MQQNAIFNLKYNERFNPTRWQIINICYMTEKLKYLTITSSIYKLTTWHPSSTYMILYITKMSTGLLKG